MKTSKTVVSGMLWLRVLVLSLMASSLAKAQTSTINLTSQQQYIRGFGGMNFPRWIGDLTTAQADLAFGNGAGQIGFSILRIDVPPDQAQWSANVPTAVRAQSHGAIVFATPWSPPAAMKTNNNLIGGELSTSAYDDYANHLSSFANFMSSNGAPLYAISIQNEPDITVNYESCDWNSTQFNNFLIQQGATIPTRVIVAESFQFLRPLTDAILNNASAEAQVDIIGGHIYGGGLFSYPLAASKGKEVWMTEHLVNNTDWAGALATGKEIHDCMVANFNAYVWWYIRRSYGPIDESGIVTKRGFVMSQFTKFVRPGYYRIDATATPTSGVSVSAYKDGTTLVIVALNQNSSTRNITFSFSGGTATNITKWETTGTQGNNVTQIATYSGGSSLANTLAANSINTFRGTIGATGGNTHVWLEAECGTVGSLWNTNSSGTASNGSYVTIQPGNNSTASAPSSSTGHVSFPFSVSESGNYRVWGRVITPNGNDDSFWVRMDGGSWTNWNSIPATSSWQWDDVHDSNNGGSVVNYNLSPGNHTLTVAYREDGAQLDKIYVTNSGQTPSGTGSAANNCSASPSLSVSPATLSFGSGAGNSTVTVTSNISWSVTDNQTWISVSPTSGSNNGSFTVSVTSNGGASRSGTVTVSGSGLSQNLSVSQSGATGDVWLEAECGTVGSLWNTSASGSASNGSYVVIQPGNNSTGSAPTNTNGHINYNFSVGAGGSYVVWCRVIAPNANDDSFWIRMDGGAWINWNNIAPGATSWTWDDVQSFSLSSGSHTLTIAYREDGTQLDKIFITNAGTTPSGMGSAATNCGAGKAFSEASLDEALPAGYSLSANYPNPFNPATQITYTLGEAVEVKLEVFDLTGRLVATLANGLQSAGRYEVTFDAQGLESGVYFYRLHAGSFTQTRRMLLVK